MIDTGGTICAGARLLREQGAKRVIACATHAVFSPPASERLSTEGLFEQVVVTSSIPDSAGSDVQATEGAVRCQHAR